MWKGTEGRFPSFWLLQVVGWSSFYLLVLVSVFPYRRKEEFLDQTIACATMFLGSCLLRPVCRALQRRSLSWIELELRALTWSAVVGTVGAFLSGLAIVRVVRMVWIDFLVNDLQISVVLFLWCTLYFGIKQWQQSTLERERLLRAETDAREARLSALRYQLNPHFLFNSLNAVSTLVLDGNAHAATRMLAQIGELLRTSLDHEVLAEIPLSQEIALTKLYLAIEQTRLGDRLRVDIAVPPETLDAIVPGMLLQPLVENAIRHGVGRLVEGGSVAISTESQGERLRLVIRNSGKRNTPQSDRANGIGLRNTRERLEALYGTDQSFCLAWPEPGVCEVTVEVPFRRAVEAHEVLACEH